MNTILPNTNKRNNNNDNNNDNKFSIETIKKQIETKLYYLDLDKERTLDDFDKLVNPSERTLNRYYRIINGYETSIYNCKIEIENL